MSDGYFKQSGLIWWMIIISISIISLLYLDVWAFYNMNMKAFVSSTIFMLFIIIPFVFEMKKYLIPEGISFQKCAISYSLGLIISSLIGVLANIRQTASIFSMFTITTQQLLSQVSSQLPLFWSKFIDTQGASTAEELIFMIAAPVILFSILNYIGKQTRLTFLSDARVQIPIVIAVVAPMFALFHVGNAVLVTFIISAIAFRAILLGLVWGDIKENLVPFLLIAPAFAVGFHQGNNIMATGGWSSFVSVMLTNPFGYAVLIFVGLNIASLLYFVFKKAGRLKK